MSDVYLYTTRYCPFCLQAKQLLSSKGVEFREISVDNNPDLRVEMMQLSGQRTVPQIWIGQTHIGGCDELWALERAEQLDTMLQLCESNPND
ncbi:MAG: glutaredoxin 3 [Spongiibacteraceae bacterium]|nr:glutaredoxin 3 [Spongiibacteraceae bacterium]